MSKIELFLGDSKEQLKALPDNSVDAVVTDPPYGLSFMGKKWDYDVPSVELWREVYRVLKPGGHVLSFGGTRTYHRMVVNIEDAGFEIRDQVQWIYGSGFPKSTDVSKRIDKEAGAEREVVGLNTTSRLALNKNLNDDKWNKIGTQATPISAPATPEAKQWQGWGTALKPANEPIVLARKPLEKGLTVAENVLKYGTGAINVDGCRIGYEAKDLEVVKAAIERMKKSNNQNGVDKGAFLASKELVPNDPSKGRWPANVLFDETAAEMLDEQSGILRQCSTIGQHEVVNNFTFTVGEQPSQKAAKGFKANTYAGASRFFYVAKASKSERNRGLEGMPMRFTATMGDGIGKREHNPDEPRAYNQNHHPTVKPIKLMEYLIKLITPPNGTILDPFLGSGSTGVAAKNLGFSFVGVELNEEYIEIAKRRIGECQTVTSAQSVENTQTSTAVKPKAKEKTVKKTAQATVNPVVAAPKATTQTTIRTRTDDGW